MNANHNNNNSEATVVSDIGPGAMLANQRQKKGMDEKAAANALKISIYRLKAIEANDYSDFPSETYVRGHLRNYARLVQLDEQLILQAYDEQEHGIQRQSDQESELIIAHTHKQWWFVYVVLVVLVLLWVLSYWLLGGSKPPETSSVPTIERPAFNASRDFSSSVQIGETVEPTEQQSPPQAPPSSVTPVPAESQAATDANQAAPDTDQAANQATPNTDQAAFDTNDPKPKVEGDEMVVSKVTAAELVKSVIAEDQQKLEETAATSMVASGDSLSFSFENACWIKVTDATDEVIFAGLQQAGTDLSLYGKAPFRIVIGNVDGTSLSYNGEPVQLTARGNNKSLRLQVGG